MSKKLGVIRTSFFLLTGLSVASLSFPALAAECLSSPGEAAPGRQWFYRTDKISKQRCWFAKETREMAPRDRAGDSSSLRNQSSGGYEQELPVAPPEAESPVKSWFSSNFPSWDGWGSRTEPLELPSKEATLPRKRSANERNEKTSQQSKQKHKSERRVSERTKQKAAHRVARVLETAGHKDVPDATFEFDKNWQNVMEAVREKDVLARRAHVEDWQKALYEEFLVWRTKQIMFGYGD
jgi:hypothetical protein